MKVKLFTTKFLSLKSSSTRKKLVLISFILTISVILTLTILLRTVFLNLFIQEQIEYKNNSLEQFENHLDTITKNIEIYAQKIYLNNRIINVLNSNYDRDDYSSLKDIKDTLDREIENIYVYSEFVNSVILLGSNNLTYMYNHNPNSLGSSYMSNDFDFKIFMNQLEELDLRTVKSVPFFQDSSSLMKMEGRGNDDIFIEFADKVLFLRFIYNSENKISGVAVIVLNKDFLSTVFTDTEMLESTYVYSTGGNMIWSSTGLELQGGIDKFGIVGERGRVENYLGEKSLVTSDALKEYDFIMVSVRQLKSIMYNLINYHTLIYFLLSIIFSIFVSHFLSKKIISPLNRMISSLRSDVDHLENFAEVDPKPFMNFINLRNKITVYFIITVILPSIIYAMLLVSEYVDVYRNNIILNTRNTLQQIKHNIDRNLMKYNTISEQLITNETIQNYYEVSISNNDVGTQRQETEKLLSETKMLYKDLVSVGLYFNSGQNFYSSIYFDTLPVTSVSSKFFEIMSTNSGEMTYITSGKDFYQNEVIYFARKIRGIYSGNFTKQLGYFLFSVDKNIFKNSERNTKLSNTGYYKLIDRNGNILFNSSMASDKNLFDGNNTIEEKLNQDNGSISIKKNGKNYMVIYNTLNSFNIKIVGVVPYDDVNTKVNSVLWYGSIVLVLYFMAFLFFSYLISFRITKPLKKLKMLMDDVKIGNFDVRMSYKGKDEIGILAMHFNNMVRSLKELIVENYQSKMRESQLLFLEKEAQLNALQQQINPHFLYNTLESIKWSAFTKGNMEVFEMLTALGVFFKGSIVKGERLVTIEGELEHLNSYIYIQKIRFKERFDYVEEVDPQIKRYKIPKLVLQPIVENAISHGIELSDNSGIVTLRGFKEGDRVFFEISDNGLGMTEERLEQVNSGIRSKQIESNLSGVGLNNVFNRLILHFGDKVDFEIKSNQREGTVVKLSFPVQEISGEAGSKQENEITYYRFT